MIPVNLLNVILSQFPRRSFHDKMLSSGVPHSSPSTIARNRSFQVIPCLPSNDFTRWYRSYSSWLMCFNLSPRKRKAPFEASNRAPIVILGRLFIYTQGLPKRQPAIMTSAKIPATLRVRLRHIVPSCVARATPAGLPTMVIGCPQHLT